MMAAINPVGTFIRWTMPAPIGKARRATKPQKRAWTGNGGILIGFAVRSMIARFKEKPTRNPISFYPAERCEIFAEPFAESSESASHQTGVSFCPANGCSR